MKLIIINSALKSYNELFFFVVLHWFNSSHGWFCLGWNILTFFFFKQQAAASEAEKAAQEEIVRQKLEELELLRQQEEEKEREREEWKMKVSSLVNLKKIERVTTSPLIATWLG